MIFRFSNGNPVMIGVKNNPDMNINWTWDHALLVVGYNEITDELIYNDFNNRKRMPAGQLITKDGRYTFINHRNLVYAIEFLGFSGKEQ